MWLACRLRTGKSIIKGWSSSYPKTKALVEHLGDNICILIPAFSAHGHILCHSCSIQPSQERNDIVTVYVTYSLPVIQLNEHSLQSTCFLQIELAEMCDLRINLAVHWMVIAWSGPTTNLMYWSMVGNLEILRSHAKLVRGQQLPGIE